MPDNEYAKLFISIAFFFFALFALCAATGAAVTIFLRAVKWLLKATKKFCNKVWLM